MDRANASKDMYDVHTWIEVQVFKWENKEGEIDFDKRGGGNERGVWKTKIDFDKHGGVIFFVEVGIVQNRLRLLET